MNEKELIRYYNKFNEDKRLKRRHGIVEYNTTLFYINKYLEMFTNPKIIDIGAGTGAYSLYLYNKGYNVTALELVKHNLKEIEKKNNNIKTHLGNALDLSAFSDSSFDIVLLMGPLYHLISEEEKIKALKEAKRIVKDTGYIFVSYITKDYAIIKHGFIDNYIDDNNVDSAFNIISNNSDLYSYLTIDDIDKLNTKCSLKRVSIIGVDGPTDYIRKEVNSMDENKFKKYLNYIISISNRKDLIGASSHLLDIVRK